MDTNTSHDAELIRLILNELEAPEQSRVQELLGSDAIRDRLDTLQSMIGNVDGLRANAGLFDVSEAQRRRLIGLFRGQEAGVVSRAIEAAGRLLANLVFDSLHAPQLAMGFRGVPGHRLLRYECDAANIDVRISKDASGLEHYWITGTLESIQTPIGLIAEPIGSGQRAVTSTQDDGYFELKVDPGVYELRFDFGAKVVVLELPKVGDAAA